MKSLSSLLNLYVYLMYVDRLPSNEVEISTSTHAILLRKKILPYVDSTRETHTHRLHLHASHR